MFNPYYNAPYYNPYQAQIPPAVPDNLAQMRAQQMQGQQPQQAPQAPRQAPDERIWVQGEVGAKAFLVVPGNTVPLWDSEQQVIWLKSVNAAGVPVMSKLTYTIDNGATAPPNAQEYITRTEFEQRLREIVKASEQKEESGDA